MNSTQGSMRLYLNVFLLLSVGCSTSQRSVKRALPAEMECKPPAVKGSPELFGLANNHMVSVQVGEPTTCEGNPGAYIGLRGSGHREIVIGRGELNGYAGCSPEAAFAAPDGCPKIQFDLFADTLTKRIQENGIVTNGAGLGVCGEATTNYEDWNPSVKILDWADANIAVEETARLMHELQIGNTFGISVTHPLCVHYGMDLGRRDE